jgi:FkbM family methyltransferase
LAEWGALFADFESIRNYRTLALSRRTTTSGGDESRVVRLLPRAVLGEVWCRTGTTDFEVFRDTFAGQFHLPPPDVLPHTILDLGSNIGLTIAHYASLFPGASLLGVELDRDNFRLCERNIALYGDRCRVRWGAAWCWDGTVKYDGDTEWGYRVCRAPSDQLVREAPAFSIDTLLDDFAVDTVDFVKMDIEGAEEHVLRHGGRWCDRVRSMKIEIHAPYSVAACLDDLRRHGFSTEVDSRHNACVIARRKR